MRFDPSWFEIISELLVNLSAGWFGAVLIVPIFAGREFPFNFAILTSDVLGGILSLVVALKLRKLSREVS